LEREQERRRETKREEGEQWGTDPKVELLGSTQVNTVTASSLAKEAGDVSTAGFNRTCSNGRSRKNECSDGKSSIEDRVSSKKPIYYGCR